MGKRITVRPTYKGERQARIKAKIERAEGLAIALIEREAKAEAFRKDVAKLTKANDERRLEAKRARRRKRKQAKLQAK